ncbi:MAG: hypothetical protein QM775_27000 [Pirellulales bacterium]
MKDSPRISLSDRKKLALNPLPAAPLFPQPPIAQGTTTPPTQPAGSAVGSQPAGSFMAPAPLAPAAQPNYAAQPPLSTIGPVSWQPATQELEEAKILARVGGEVIMAGEVMSSVKGYLIRNQLDPNNPEVAAQMDDLIKLRTMQLVETRILCNEAKRKIPAEGFKNAMGKFEEEFDKSIIPQMIKDRKLQTVQDLEAVLKKEGTSIEREKRSFGEQVLRNSWISSSIKVEQDVTHEELLKFYRDRAKEFEITAEARWEQLSIRFDKYPTKGEAYAAIADAGNQVLDGRPFAEVAKQASHGSTAANGGVHDWTKKGSLVSQTLDGGALHVARRYVKPDPRRRARVPHHPHRRTARRRLSAVHGSAERHSQENPERPHGSRQGQVLGRH